MNDTKSVSDKLLQKSMEAKAKLAKTSDERSIEASLHKSLNRQFLLTVLTATLTGIVAVLVFGSFSAPETTIESLILFIIAAVMLGGVSVMASLFARWYATTIEKELRILEKMQGKTQGVVTSMRKEIRGAVSNAAGWTYAPVFTVEYEVAGKTYTTDWELSYSSNSEKLLQRSERKHMGVIIPVRYNVDTPENAMARPPENYRLAKTICFLTAFLGFSSISSVVTAVIYFA